jgi:hypothetical protein
MSSTHERVKLSMKEGVEGYRCVSCEVRISSTYERLTLST